MFYILLLFVIALDQAAKLWIRFHMELGESIPVWRGFQLTYIHNSGAMGSSFEGYGKFFVIPAVLIIIGTIYYLHKGRLNGAVTKAGAALFAGGAAGNAIDRLMFGEVTDFLDVGRGISNFADHAISLGLLFIIIQELIIAPLQRRKAKRLCH
ncbi:signal peptidase II [Paenibacillus protaetiae]|uniref:Lipoprotein signal peptidase n=1 Tax=Paenibacillus protaetiae TaxID=2509456 RepID=A0A4P6F5K2_9BACL|nr:signal peptidase II [Paenibacillus protaetiae]QAY68487.1 signal peptidase II [Paenibacillus protaetiae]